MQRLRMFFEREGIVPISGVRFRKMAFAWVKMVVEPVFMRLKIIVAIFALGIYCWFCSHTTQTHTTHNTHMKILITDLETVVLNDMFKDASGNGHDFGIVENITCLPMTQVRGILASLVKKDIILVDYKGPNGWTNWTWNHAGDMSGNTPESINPKSIQDVLPEA